MQADEAEVLRIEEADGVAQFCAGLDLKEQQPGDALGVEAMMGVQHSIGGVMIAMEDRQPVLCIQRTDFREGMAAFLEKRPPQYRNT